MSNFPLAELFGYFNKDGSRALRVLGEMQMAGSNVEQQLTEKDAVSGKLTFSKNLSSIGIYNTDQENAGVFNVNGIDIHVPAGESFEANIGGTPKAIVQVSGAATYIVTRYV
ncbi:hypothetical protein [Priestia filamentosa]|uniref:hypothetical protein n=1 Tax=Priestia filamentosa TaxID=1402861 RepID=UPI000A08CAA7|nr:hypothetical protein [Priestia filamentosa]MDT3762959.1 hypothetical protein [Priestia filamentosa]OXS69481.1 hypothetical protein B1B01_10965 [Priestia filamentosa]WRU97400.1 hypothetical protein RYX51_10120 [Priestia filamentosa]SMF33100.1 hypothetical protein SAMN06296056_102765 [Priestia filamentosa]